MGKREENRTLRFDSLQNIFVSIADFLRPNTCLDLSDVSCEEGTWPSRLSDPPPIVSGNRPLTKPCAIPIQTVFITCNGNLATKGFFIYRIPIDDKFKGSTQRLIPNENIAIQTLVAIFQTHLSSHHSLVHVHRAVFRLAIRHRYQSRNCTKFFTDSIFTFFRC